MRFSILSLCFLAILISAVGAKNAKKVSADVTSKKDSLAFPEMVEAPRSFYKKLDMIRRRNAQRRRQTAAAQGSKTAPRFGHWGMAFKNLALARGQNAAPKKPSVRRHVRIVF